MDRYIKLPEGLGLCRECKYGVWDRRDEVWKCTSKESAFGICIFTPIHPIEQKRRECNNG